nr:gustatory receptor 43.1 [Papilio dardanus]
MLRRKFNIEKSRKVFIKHNTDFVLDNFLEAEMKPALLPLYVAQWLSLAPKYSLRYDLVTSNGHKFNAFVCLCSVAISASWFYIVLNFLLKAVRMYAITIFAYSITLVVGVILNSIITVSHSNMNAYLIILLQRIFKRFVFVNIDIKNITKVNWIFLIIMAVYNIALFTTRLLESSSTFVSKFLIHFIYISIDCNSIIAIRTIHLLGKLMDTWISELKTFSYANCADTEANNYMNKIIVGYDELIQALNICDKVFRVPVFFTVLSCFFQVFVNVQAAISVSNIGYHDPRILAFLLFKVPVWTRSMYVAQFIWVKNITLLALLSKESESIHLKVKNAQVASVVVCARGTTAETSRLVRRQGQRAGDGRWLRAAGLFPVDAALPPSFLAVLATYTVVLLQFQFL